MSTGYECYFVEVKPGEWYYVLQNSNCPVGAWDWREFATAYGPFGSQDAADDHLRRNHANPGGHSVHEYREGYEPDKVEAELLASARK